MKSTSSFFPFYKATSTINDLKIKTTSEKLVRMRKFISNFIEILYVKQLIEKGEAYF